MGGDQRRQPRGPHQPGEAVEDEIRRGRVEVAGRLVGEQQARRVGDGAGDRHPLLLAAGKLARPVLGALLHPHIGEKLH